MSKQNTCLADRRGLQVASQIENAALFNYHAEVDNYHETKETHLIPRKSITLKQHLQIIPSVRYETIDLKFRVVEKETDADGNTKFIRDDRGKLKWIAGTNPKAINTRYVRQSQNLLVTSRPGGVDADRLNLQRVTSRSKRKIYDDDVNFTPLPRVTPEASVTYSADDPIFGTQDDPKD